jgi:hypothetical protein
MTEAEAVRKVIAQLERDASEYFLVGAIAYNLYGIPRFTKDADFVLSLTVADVEQLFAGLPEELSIDPQSRMELFTATTRWVANHAGTELKIEFFLLGNDAHHQEEFRRRRRAWLPKIEAEAWVATAEDLVIQKLRWARNKDIDDVRNILAVQGEALDFAYIEKWCGQHGTLSRLREVRASIPPGL